MKIPRLQRNFEEEEEEKKKEKLCTTQRAESRLICRLGAISRCVGAASLPPVSADVDYRVGAERGKNVYIQDGA